MHESVREHIILSNIIATVCEDTPRLICKGLMRFLLQPFLQSFVKRPKWGWHFVVPSELVNMSGECLPQMQERYHTTHEDNE